MPILVNRNEARDVENTTRGEWVISVLEALGVPVDDWPKEPSYEDLRKMRNTLKALDVDIIDDRENGIEIYFQNNLIAEWRRPFFKLMKDPNERDPKYQRYLEMTLNCKVYFGNEEDKEDTETE